MAKKIVIPTEPRLPPFVYYSGAYWPRNFSPLGVWVKYIKGPPGVRELAEGLNWLHVQTPDRELMFVRNSHTPGADRPLDDGWDQYVNFSLGDSSAQDHEVDRYMVNYYQHTRLPKSRKTMAVPRAEHNKANSPNIRLADTLVRDKKTIMSDSGGFQILTGKAEWIDPVDLGKWFARNCDEGIVLDIPVPFDDDDLIKRAAHIQARNTDILLEHVPETFTLFNTIHGKNMDSMYRFRDIVERDYLNKGVCIAGAYIGNHLSQLSKMLHHLLNPNYQSYQQYHVLGIYNVAMLTPIIRFAALMRKQGATFSISSDASTALYSAGNRTFHHQRVHYRSAERIAMGRSSSVPVGNVPNPYRHLPCGCAFCSTIKYNDVLSICNSAIVAHELYFHNMMEIDRWSKMMVHYAEELDSKQFSELIDSQFNNHKGRSVKLAVRFIETIVGEGIEKANKEFSHHMDSMFDENMDEQALFGEGAEIQVESDPEVFKARIEKTFDRYEAYHKTGEAPDLSTVKRSSAKRSVKKVMSNSASPRAGKSLKKKTKKTKSLMNTTGVSSHAKKKVTLIPTKVD